MNELKTTLNYRINLRAGFKNSEKRVEFNRCLAEVNSGKWTPSVFDEVASMFLKKWGL